MSELLTHHTKLINGFRMHYVTAGSGYPLVFVHGGRRAGMSGARSCRPWPSVLRLLPRTCAGWGIPAGR